MRGANRKSAPKVKAGRVQKKNNQTYTGNYFDAAMPWLVLDRRRPGRGYRHLLDNVAIYSFLTLVPGWQDLEHWLNAIVLDAGDPDMFGWHTPGVIGICAWPRDLWMEWHVQGFRREKALVDMLQVPYDVDEENDSVLCRFTEKTASGHQLLGTLLHEIGHHHDRITTRSRESASRGEPYAREYAIRTAEEIFDRYVEKFGI